MGESGGGAGSTEGNPGATDLAETAETADVVGVGADGCGGEGADRPAGWVFATGVAWGAPGIADGGERGSASTGAFLGSSEPTTRGGTIGPARPPVWAARGATRGGTEPGLTLMAVSVRTEGALKAVTSRKTANTPTARPRTPAATNPRRAPREDLEGVAEAVKGEDVTVAVGTAVASRPLLRPAAGPVSGAGTATPSRLPE